MNSKKIVSGLALVLISMGCSKGQDQYKAPPDQRIDKHADPAPTVVPKDPSAPDLGLVDGWYVEPTAEQESKTITDAIYSPVILGSGMAGIDISMSRSEIENKLGQPDFVATDSDLRPIGVYGGGSFFIYYDRVTKAKVESIIAGNGYLGAITEFGLKVGSDLAPLLAAEGGTAGLMKKIYSTSSPLIEDCNAVGLCQALKGNNLGLLALTNTVQILFQDDPNKPEKKIFEIRVLSRTPAAGAYQGAWSLDLLDSSLTQLDKPEAAPIRAGTATWADVRAAGRLETLVEPRDFGRSLNSFGVKLSNELSFNFARGDVTIKGAKSPVDSDRLNIISAGVSFAGQLSVGGEALLFQMCKAGGTLSPAEETQAIVLSTTRLSAAAGAPPKPAGDVIATKWLPSVVLESAASAACVQVPLLPDLAYTLTSAFQALVLSENKDWLAANTGELIHSLTIETLDGKVAIAAESQADGSLMGSADPSLGFGKTIFSSTFKALLNAAKAKNPNTFDYAPSGFRSLEEKATYSQTFGMYDETLTSGKEVTLSFSESSKGLYFDSAIVSPQFANNNLALRLLAKAEAGYRIDLDGPLAVDGLHIASPMAEASTIELEPFDRSLRYAKISYAAEAPVSDFAAYSERVVLNLTNGSSVVAKTQDVYISNRGVSIAGKRVQGRSETKSILSVEGLGFGGFPYTTQFAITCAAKRVELGLNEDFNSVYEKVKSCKKFLTPGYAANSVPYELHLAPEGARSHALTLNFTEGLLVGFFVYNAN